LTSTLRAPESARRARGELERFRDVLGDTRFEDLRLLVSELLAEAVGGFGKSKDHLIRLRAERATRLARDPCRAQARSRAD
jgi:hypothetical protein